MERAERQRLESFSERGGANSPSAFKTEASPRTSGSARFGVFGGEPLMLSRCCVCVRRLVAFQRHVRAARMSKRKMKTIVSGSAAALPRVGSFLHSEL